MQKFLCTCAALAACVAAVWGLPNSKLRGEEEGRAWLEEYNERAMDMRYASVEAAWAYNTNLTDFNQQESLRRSTLLGAFSNEAARNATEFDWENFQDETVRREFSKIAEQGTSVLPSEKLTELNGLRAQMQRTYSTARVCNRPGYDPEDCFPLDPDLTNIIASSDDWEELVWAWDGWRQETGRKMSEQYEQFAALLNEAANMNNYEDHGDYLRSWYEMDGFREECERLWLQLRPLYEQLHAYVRRRLQEKYPEGDFPESGHIPAHLLGNMWAQSWGNLEPLVRPYPNRQGLDVSDEMVRQGWDAKKQFEVSEEFFTSLGLIPMPPKFWNDSMIVKPTDRAVVCHASAWDFMNQKDFRIKQCTETTMNWLITTHHEMGHVEYFLQYKDLPVKFRNGANPGFHEAIGDVLALSVATPEHLQKIGLLPEIAIDPEIEVNFLMNQALAKIAFIPFGYLIDQWRWDIFSGDTTPETYNQDWWNVRCKYQGLAPPNVRTSEDFDAGAKYHVPANTPYVRYFISHIIQFQFHKAMCDAAGHTGPLHRCDIYQSLDAGKVLGDMMAMGAAKPWPEAMEALTGSREMSAEPLVEYFKPLLDWLETENEGQPIGWANECPEGSVV